MYGDGAVYMLLCTSMMIIVTKWSSTYGQRAVICQLPEVKSLCICLYDHHHYHPSIYHHCSRLLTSAATAAPVHCKVPIVQACMLSAGALRRIAAAL